MLNLLQPRAGYLPIFLRSPGSPWTFEVCHLDAECQSPYIEKNLLHCYSSEQGREHNPWEVRHGKAPRWIVSHCN